LTRPYYRLIDAYAGENRVSDEDLELPWLGDGPVQVDYALVPSLCMHVELAAVANRPVNVHAERALAAAEDAGVLFTVGWPFFVPRIRGLAAMIDRRLDEAEGHLRRATILAERSGVSVEVARSRLDRALTLALRAKDGDYEEALVELGRARSLHGVSLP